MMISATGWVIFAALILTQMRACAHFYGQVNMALYGLAALFGLMLLVVCFANCPAGICIMNGEGQGASTAFFLSCSIPLNIITLACILKTLQLHHHRYLPSYST
eukprot:1067922-Pelagomonas_calceolata.AAC.3